MSPPRRTSDRGTRPLFGTSDDGQPFAAKHTPRRAWYATTRRAVAYGLLCRHQVIEVKHYNAFCTARVGSPGNQAPVHSDSACPDSIGEQLLKGRFAHVQSHLSLLPNLCRPARLLLTQAMHGRRGRVSQRSERFVVSSRACLIRNLKPLMHVVRLFQRSRWPWPRRRD